MLLPSNSTLVNLCADIYATAEKPSAWSHFDLGEDDGICWGVKQTLDYTIVVFRGSIDLPDWLRDGFAVPVPTWIGTVHAGFYIGMEKMWSEFRPMLRPLVPVVVTGHSLGAAHADVLCALMVKDGAIPAKRMVCGEPRPGMEDFCAPLRAISNQISFCNVTTHRRDTVTELPFRIPIPFTRPTPLTLLATTGHSSLLEDVDPFSLHHIEIYQAGIAAYEKSQLQGLAS